MSSKIPQGLSRFNTSGRLVKRFVVASLTGGRHVFLACVLLYAATSQAQETGIQDAIASGEFGLAQKMARRLPAAESDRWLGQIAEAQLKVGNQAAATSTLRQIQQDLVRADSANRMFRSQFGGGDAPDSSGGQSLPDQTPPQSKSPFGGGVQNPAGQGGGITINDYFPLINLIQSTIDPDGWDVTNGDGNLMPYAAGVLVDTSGHMQRLNIESKGELAKLRTASRLDSGNRSAAATSGLRKISLVRLEREAQLLASMGQRIPDEMKYLAGITRIEYLMFFPETNDIVIAGPAGDWTDGPDGRIVNVKTGEPVLHLDDMVVCLRNAFYDQGKFGCTIDPRPANIAATKKFAATNQASGKEWREELRQTLGRQDVTVFGIDPRTHAGRVLVEADYRMKLVGMGLEKSISEIPSYLDRVRPDGNGQLPPMDVVRWWFTLNYNGLLSDQDRTTFQFAGPGVKVLSETEMIDDRGNRIHTGKSVGPTGEFAKDFTKHFDKIADRYPIYQQLRNVFDLAMVSALIRQRNLDDSANWNLTYFGEEKDSDGRLVYSPELANAPKEVDSVMNHRAIRFKRNGKKFKSTVVGISGGVEFDSNRFLTSTKLQTVGEFEEKYRESKPVRLGEQRWWWD